MPKTRRHEAHHMCFFLFSQKDKETFIDLFFYFLGEIMNRRFKSPEETFMLMINGDPLFQKFEANQYDKEATREAEQYVELQIRENKMKKRTIHKECDLSDQDLSERLESEDKKRIKADRQDLENYKSKRFSSIGMTKGRHKKEKKSKKKIRKTCLEAVNLEKKEDQLSVFDPNVPLPAQPYYIIKAREFDNSASLSFKLVESMFKMRDRGKKSNISIIFNIMKNMHKKDVMKPRDKIRAEMLTKIYTHSRKQEDEMLRVKRYPWERSCSKQTECQGYIQYGDVLVEFLEPDVIEKAKNDPIFLPKDTGMCLRCMRLIVQICVIQIKAEMCTIGHTMLSTFQNIVGM